ncbi:amino acid/amide ABC transporter membrane protein 2 (HAAT family) [Breoghania corrubedonensis]|uniref:Amino acid/amide ABC transporter membrane protein 2 (HAAT family) n=1 Tax=Breoghania corrubedonensis TaxID=665038 RepID=A0A2T5VC65_9HYPH|nr:branched-chain amino acid ABC transporter permease [Breoghania corrubedonensis]PTW61345.1 amino acid/amide ABC transporter membrane protein 2 (HAAT family) [Breoghania corrubedonensis]
MSDRDTFLPKFAALALIGAGLVFWARSVLDPYALSIVMFVGINVILAVSLNISNGFTGLFSLGHPAFMTIGGYMTAILVMPAARKGLMLPDLPAFLAGQEWSFLPALLAGGSLSALVAVIVGFPVLRLRGHYLAVATLGLIFIVQSLAVNLDGVTRGALGLSGLPSLTTTWWVYGFVLLTLFVCWRLKHSSLGRTMLAIRENELAAACLGVRVARTRVFAFALGAFFAGIAGGLWVHVVTLISPDSFSFGLAFQLVVMVVVGGTGSITGASIVAAVLTLATEFLKPVEESLNLYGASQIAIAVGVILILIYRPAGLFGTAEPQPLNLIKRLGSRHTSPANSPE